MRQIAPLACLLLALLALVACRGQISDQPPIHPNPNMDDQEKYDPQEPSKLFSDGRAARMPVPGTVSRGSLKTDLVFYTGRTDEHSTNSFVMHSPVPTTLAELQRGQERYNIFCGACHDRAGTGKGLVVKNYRGFSPPPSFHEDRIRQMPDGEIFNTITHGIRTMPAYAAQIPEADRWAIIAYLRALQRSQQAPLSDVPSQYRSTLEGK